ncbi:hypothetical protein HUG15_00420 [Salicibibacter cibarius]|uniref:Uncharacterized protein n=1 Tax=Salicibibacter cibarius TaxID=2743000 RepID=A0A7T6YZL2_9BACI|nr:hypothetical protein [Salicibibacter cibarius]QQK74233.1 hypothetical protein HUG15_00420 [Salicibibacter cibarius]
MFNKVKFKWLPHTEQDNCESKLIKVMRRLKIEHYRFNWDRNSCYIEFRYQDKSYRLEHSIQNAKEKGIILRNGLDCLMELIHSLEDLCGIINRGTYTLETWIAGMNLSPEESEYQEELHIRYRSLGEQQRDRNETFVPDVSEPSLEDFDRNRQMRRPQSVLARNYRNG